MLCTIIHQLRRTHAHTSCALSSSCSTIKAASALDSATRRDAAACAAATATFTCHASCCASSAWQSQVWPTAMHRTNHTSEDSLGDRRTRLLLHILYTGVVMLNRHLRITFTRRPGCLMLILLLGAAAVQLKPFLCNQQTYVIQMYWTDARLQRTRYADSCSVDAAEYEAL